MHIVVVAAGWECSTTRRMAHEEKLVSRYTNCRIISKFMSRRFETPCDSYGELESVRYRYVPQIRGLSHSFSETRTSRYRDVR